MLVFEFPEERFIEIYFMLEKFRRDHNRDEIDNLLNSKDSADFYNNIEILLKICEDKKLVKFTKFFNNLYTVVFFSFDEIEDFNSFKKEINSVAQREKLNKLNS